jgi:hypothetical protein
MRKAKSIPRANFKQIFQVHINDTLCNLGFGFQKLGHDSHEEVFECDFALMIDDD